MGEIATIRSVGTRGFVRVSVDLALGLVRLHAADETAEVVLDLNDAQGETLETAIRAARRRIAHAAGGPPRR